MLMTPSLVIHVTIDRKVLPCKIDRFIVERGIMTLPYRRVHVVINPAAGHDAPILNVLNHVFHPAGVDLDWHYCGRRDHQLFQWCFVLGCDLGQHLVGDHLHLFVDPQCAPGFWKRIATTRTDGATSTSRTTSNR